MIAQSIFRGRTSSILSLYIKCLHPSASSPRSCRPLRRASGSDASFRTWVIATCLPVVMVCASGLAIIPCCVASDMPGKAGTTDANPHGFPSVIKDRTLIGVTQKGSANAAVTIIEFTDFECPFCGRVAPIIQDLLRAYPSKVRLILKHNPLPMHPHSAVAHEAALAAGAQDKNCVSGSTGP